jgi:cobyric acid synthase
MGMTDGQAGAVVGGFRPGRVFAALAGTMLLLTADEKSYVKGTVINKYREIPYLRPGLSMLEEMTGSLWWALCRGWRWIWTRDC